MLIALPNTVGGFSPLRDECIRSAHKVSSGLKTALEKYGVTPRVEMQPRAVNVEFREGAVQGNAPVTALVNFTGTATTTVNLTTTIDNTVGPSVRLF